MQCDAGFFCILNEASGPPSYLYLGTQPLVSSPSCLLMWISHFKRSYSYVWTAIFIILIFLAHTR